MGSRQQTLIRRSPNGETRPLLWSLHAEYIGMQDEPGELKYLSNQRKGNQNETPLVVTSERGIGQWSIVSNWNALERATIEGDGPVQVRML